MIQGLPLLEPSDVIWHKRRSGPIRFSFLGIKIGILESLLQLIVGGKAER